MSCLQARAPKPNRPAMPPPVRSAWPRPTSQSKPLSRHLAGLIARLAGAANIGPDAIDCAGCRNADLAHQGGAAIAVASHSCGRMVDKCAGNALELAIIFGREPGPVAGKRAAGTAASTKRGAIRRADRHAFDALPQVRTPFVSEQHAAACELPLRLATLTTSIRSKRQRSLGWTAYRRGGGRAALANFEPCDVNLTSLMLFYG
jgi:hypothetical protein